LIFTGKMNDLNIINAQIPINDGFLKVGISIKDGVITDINRPGKLRPSKVTIDADGAFIFPGFLDSFNRIRDPEDAIKSIRTYIKGGFIGAVYTVRCEDDIRIINEVKKFRFGFLIDYRAERELKEKYQDKFLYFRIKSYDDLNELDKTGRNKRIFIDISDIANEVREEVKIIEKICKKALQFRHVHVHPVTIVQGVRMINKAKKSGIKITCGTNIYNLILNEKNAALIPDRFKNGLRIRAFTHSMLMVKSVRGGSIDVLGTGHSRENHLASSSNQVLFNLVHKRKLLLKSVVNTLSVNPAKLFFNKRARVDVGEIADLTMIRMSKTHVLDGIYDKTVPRNVFSGWTVYGIVEGVIAKGNILYLRGEYGD